MSFMSAFFDLFSAFFAGTSGGAEAEEAREESGDRGGRCAVFDDLTLGRSERPIEKRELPGQTGKRRVSGVGTVWEKPRHRVSSEHEA